MPKRLILLVVASASLMSAHTRAQTTSTPSAKALAIRDSVFAQAAAIRIKGSNHVVRFKSHHFAIRSLRTATRSYVPVKDNIPTLVKKHVVKHKTTGVLVEKVTYFVNNRKQLREEYHNGQLANFTLVSNDVTKGAPKETIQFVQGDYLSITRQYNPLLVPKEQKPAREFYHYPVPPIAR
jgi:hypothetical protein